MKSDLAAVVQQVPGSVEESSQILYKENVPPKANQLATSNHEQQSASGIVMQPQQQQQLEQQQPLPVVMGSTSRNSSNNCQGLNIISIDELQHLIDVRTYSQGQKRLVIVPIAASSINHGLLPTKRPRLQDFNSSACQQVAQQPAKNPEPNMLLKHTFGVNAWKQWIMSRNDNIEKSSCSRLLKLDLLQMTAEELNFGLALFVREVRKPNGLEYAPDTIYYFILGIQQYLYVNGRVENIFFDPFFEHFVECLDEVSKKFFLPSFNASYIVTRVEEEHLWECKQLGAHSPYVLLSTIIYFNKKFLNLKNAAEHMQLNFLRIERHWKRCGRKGQIPPSTKVFLRFNKSTVTTEKKLESKVCELHKDEKNPFRCPVVLYDLYISKCPESVRYRTENAFYLEPEPYSLPESPAWYSTQALTENSIQRILNRFQMIK